MDLFCERLRRAIDAKGIQQKELALSCGFSTARLNNYVMGRTEPSLDALASICTALNVSADYLLGIRDGPQRPQHSTVSFLSQQIPRSPLDDLTDSYRAQAESYIGFLRQQQDAERRASTQDA